MREKGNDLASEHKLRLLFRRLLEESRVARVCDELGIERDKFDTLKGQFLEYVGSESVSAPAAEAQSLDVRIAALEGALAEKDRELAELHSQLARLEEADLGMQRAEEASRKSERRYQHIFQSVPISIWEEDYSQLRISIDELRDQGVVDFGRYVDEHPDFVEKAVQMIRVTDVNSETLKMFGARNKEELLGAPAQVLPPGSPDSFREELKAIAEGRPVFESEGVTHTLSGEKLHVVVRIAIPSHSEHFGHMLLTLLDITDRKNAEEGLRRSEERFRAIFEAAQDSIYIKDVSLRYTHVNPALAALLGTDRARLIGCSDEELFGVEAGIHLREVDLRVLKGETIEEEHTRTVLGAHRTFHDMRVPIRNAEGSIIGMCGISRDITERKIFSESLRPKKLEYPSPAMISTLSRARYAAATDCVVLLLGESGSGKDQLARYIHAHSPRNKGPFFSINCAAINQELVESELFGHEPGAFTGARNRKRGLLELAEGGTLLLNEVGEIPLVMQSKLLTFLDTKSFMRVGGEKAISVNARLIAATHRDLKQEVAAGRFSEALFYRLDVFSIRIPPLRERLEDIPILAEEIMAKLVADMHLPDKRSLGPRIIREFANHHWPGNVRELRNAIERLLILPDRHQISFPIPAEKAGADNWQCSLKFPADMSLCKIRNEITRSLCVEALRRTHGNKRKAAGLLGISRYSFYRHLKLIGIECENVTLGPG